MVAPISYAERARRAQNIRSPIAAPPPHPAPTPPTVLGGDNTSSTSNASATSTAPSSSTVSTSFSAATDDTPNSSIVLATRDSSPILSQSSSKAQQVPRPTTSIPGKPGSAATIVAARTPSPQLAAKALSIVAAHTAPSAGVARPAAAAAAVNVWSQRIERMAAARAAVVPAVQAHNSSPGSLPAINGKPLDNQLSSTMPGKDTVDQQASALDVAGTPNPISTSTSTNIAPAPSITPTSTSVTVQLTPSSSSEPPTSQLAGRDLASAEVWPEVGKSVLALSTSTSAYSLRPSESVQTANEESVDDNQEGSKRTKSSTKNKNKSKWVPIPAAELQAAADAAVAARKSATHNNGQQRKGGRGSSNAQSNTNSNITTDANNSHANTSAHNTPRSHSGRTSAAQSRAQSTQNSPRVARGKRLPLEEGISGITLDAGPSTQSRPTSQHIAHAAQYQYPSQPSYLPSPHYPSPGHTPTPDPLLPYPPHAGPGLGAPYPRHQSHPMQPAAPPSPSAHAFQVSAQPFFPQSRMPPPPADAAGFPSGAAYPPPPGPYAPPMFPVYAPGYGYSGWQGHGPAPVPGFAYGPPPQQAAPFVPSELSDGQGQAPPPPPVPALQVAAAPRSGVEEEKGEIATSVSATTLREKMMFGSIRPSSVDAINGHTGNGVNGVVIGNGHMDISTGKDEGAADGDHQVADAPKGGKEGKGRTNKAKSTKAASRDGDNSKPTGKALAASLDDGSGSIPAVQASQSMQAEIRWKFGTASSTPPVQREKGLPPADDLEPTGHQQASGEVQPPPVEAGLLHGSSTMPAISGAHLDGDSLSPFVAALDLRASASFAHLPPPPPHPHLETALGLAEDSLVLAPAGADPDLVVKDYGFGFGAGSGSGYGATTLAQEECPAREREAEAQRWREEQQNAALRSEGRAGNELLGGGAEAGPSHTGYAPRDQGYARGGDGPQNARGGRRGFGAGPGGRGGERGGGYGGRRGRGANGYSRGYGRNGYSRGGGGSGGVSHRSPPFTVTPPQHMIPLSPMGEHHQPIPGAGYYPPPRQVASYLAPPGVNGFDRYPLPPPLPSVNGTPVPHISPPVPVPLSPISFPLDPTRYYLLGQLEYYLSPQNMAQDFFLRQQMDSRGWIPISLIASFNRVKQLTMDAQLVRDVLTLSSLVQVRGTMVRMGGWERFVLPDASPSTIEDQPLTPVYQNMGPYPDEPAHDRHPQQPYQQNYPNQHAEQQRDNFNAPWPSAQRQGAEAAGGKALLVNGRTDASHADEEEEDDEEEDVVFVMGQDVGKWSLERGSA